MSVVSWRCLFGFLLWMGSAVAWAQAPEKVIIDTDIGDDVDDAFAGTGGGESGAAGAGGNDDVWGYGDAGEDYGPVSGEVGRENSVLAGRRRRRRIRCRSGVCGESFGEDRTGTRWSFTGGDSEISGEITLIAIGP